MPYSVSPRVVDHRVGPKPMKYFVAFMPNRLAATKWPLSCSITENSRATRKMTQPIWSTCGSSYLLPVELSRPCPRPGVHREHVLERGHSSTRRLVF